MNIGNVLYTSVYDGRPQADHKNRRLGRHKVIEVSSKRSSPSAAVVTTGFYNSDLNLSSQSFSKPNKSRMLSRANILNCPVLLVCDWCCSEEIDWS